MKASLQRWTAMTAVNLNAPPRQEAEAVLSPGEETLVNHNQKVIESIDAYHATQAELEQARQALADAERRLSMAEIEACRQLKNVVGVGKSVVLDGKLYQAKYANGGGPDDPLKLTVSDCEMRFLAR